MTTPIQTDLQTKALEQLQIDAQKIEQLIALQLGNLTLPKCPLYEEVLDTQMFGLSREIDFAVRLGLIDQESGKKILHELERKLAELYSTILSN
ncbi:YlaN family protein [Risungbinella massiliensis]|uniref:YlaN family protein n=1 Tax=Risungbinella massiliensis TaxID=1329796 RepID=UPI0005CC3210|nr:YlaN family protein [Risungbinella massiliensis]